MNYNIHIEYKNGSEVDEWSSSEDELYTLLEELKKDDDMIGFEVYRILISDEVDEDDTTEKVKDTNTYSVNLHFKGKVHHLLVPYPKRILEVALANKIDLPYSCSGGVCSTCVATCVSGGVRMDYNEVLTDDEVQKGRVLVCTAHPTQNETTIVWE
jgi:ring-1,2-phenylacetyl-CoA epoxidase subunit PaaE